MESLECLGKFT